MTYKNLHYDPSKGGDLGCICYDGYCVKLFHNPSHWKWELMNYSLYTNMVQQQNNILSVLVKDSKDKPIAIKWTHWIHGHFTKDIYKNISDLTIKIIFSSKFHNIKQWLDYVRSLPTNYLNILLIDFPLHNLQSDDRHLCALSQFYSYRIVSITDENQICVHCLEALQFLFPTVIWTDCINTRHNKRH